MRTATRRLFPLCLLILAACDDAGGAADDGGGLADGVPPDGVSADGRPADGPPDAAAPLSFRFEQILGPEDGLRAPDGLFVRPDGRVLIANEQGGEVLLLDVDARTLEVVVHGRPLIAPEEVALGPDGTLYISDDSAQTVFKVVDGQAVLVVGAEHGLQSPEGIAVTPDGTLFVADEKVHVLIRRDPDGEVTTIADEGDGVFAPEGLALGPDGSLYATDDRRGGVLVVRPGGAVEVFADRAALGLPEAVAVGPDGDLWFTDNGGDATLQRFSPRGEHLGTWAVPVETGHLAGIALLADGRVLMSAFHNSGVHALWLATPEAR